MCWHKHAGIEHVCSCTQLPLLLCTPALLCTHFLVRFPSLLIPTSALMSSILSPSFLVYLLACKSPQLESTRLYALPSYTPFYVLLMHTFLCPRAHLFMSSSCIQTPIALQVACVQITTAQVHTSVCSPLMHTFVCPHASNYPSLCR